MFETKKKEYEENLIHRRKKLADLYNYEINVWRQEVLSHVETQEDRKARLVSHINRMLVFALLLHMFLQNYAACLRIA